MDRRSELPGKFTKEERECYQWLYDSDVKGWLVDLLDKTVMWVDRKGNTHTSESLVVFARLRGMK